MILENRIKSQWLSEEEHDFYWYSYEVNHYAARDPT